MTIVEANAEDGSHHMTAYLLTNLLDPIRYMPGGDLMTMLAQDVRIELNVVQKFGLDLVCIFEPSLSFHVPSHGFLQSGC